MQGYLQKNIQKNVEETCTSRIYMKTLRPYTVNTKSGIKKLQEQCKFLFCSIFFSFGNRMIL